MLLRKKEEIEAWLKQYKITNYELIKDEEYNYVVNVYEDVYLSYQSLKSIDVKFNIIYGSFICNNNDLDINSFEAFPEKVNSYYCNISNNKKFEKFQSIMSFNEIKKYINEIVYLKKEKEKLLNVIESENLHKNNVVNKI